MKREKRGRNREVVLGLSAGLFTRGVDVVLFAASLGLNLYAAQLFPKDPVTLVGNSVKLARYFREKLLKRYSAYAKARKWLKQRRGELELTVKGTGHFEEKIPKYKEHRPWDGRLYLVTYDINELKKFKRDQLRRWLRQEGAGLIQKSVWVSAYDLTDKIEAAGIIGLLDGTVLVSCLKKGTGIGKETIEGLVKRVYRLAELNKRYSWFVTAVENRLVFSVEEKFLLKMQYLAILKDDPQLPRGLLSKGWQGDRAYGLYKERLKV